jgi:hypothetical protein
MAILTGALQLRGTIDNLSYYKHPNGKTIVRKKGGPPAERVRTHHNFQRTRENIKDFGTTASVASKVRKAMMPYMEYMSDGTYFNRLVGLVKLVGKTDRTNSRGSKHAYDGNIHLLEDFQWNAKLGFDKAVKADYCYTMDPATGSMSMDIVPFIPLADIEAPHGATHFQIMLRGCSIYHGNDRGNIQMIAAPLMELNSQKIDGVTLTLENKILEKEGQGLLIMGAGIIFYEEVDGIPFAIRGAGAFAMLGVERTVIADKETGEILEELTPQDQEARKAAHRSALDLLIASMQAQHYNLGKGGSRTPLQDLNGSRADYSDKLLQRGRALWLKKLDGYRRGLR